MQTKSLQAAKDTVMNNITQLKPEQDLAATGKEVNSLVHRLRCEGTTPFVLAAVLINAGLRCLSDAGCARRKAKDICIKAIEITKWRNQL